MLEMLNSKIKLHNMIINQPKLIQKVSFIILIVINIQVYGLDIYVSKKGNDKYKGTFKKPVASIERAKELAKVKAGKEAVTIIVGDGTYYLPQTLVLQAEHSGTKDKPVVFRAENEGKAIISGGSLLNLTWKIYKEGIYQAKTPKGISIDQLFVNGKNQRMARYPNYNSKSVTKPYNGYAADAISKDKAATWKNPKGAFIHAMHIYKWGGYHYEVTGKDENGELTYEGGWQNNRQMGMHKDYRMIENVFEELDAQGEWYHDARTNTLYYYPEENVNLESAKIEVVRLKHLIEFTGTEAVPVKHISVEGFVFRHTARTFMDTKEPLLRSDWTIYRGGAVLLTGTEDISILDSEFDQVGGNAIFVSNYNRNTLVKGCYIHDTGASGVCFVGDPDAVRNPLFEYGQKNDLSKIDLTVGPKTNNYPAEGVVEDCLIHGIGRTERQPAGVMIDMAQYISVLDVSIYDCARSGINIGDGAWGGHLIDRCDVFKTVQETHDHGSFNSWGRDRFWRPDRRASQIAIDKNPQLPFLDAMETNVIRNSRWRCDHGWDIDLDDGSTNYDIYNNVLLGGGLKLREGFRRRAWNNIIIGRGFHPHVWFPNSKDEFFNNITNGKHKGVGVPSKNAKGKNIDKNLFYGRDIYGKDAFVEFGWDMNSVYGNPMFLDPKNGDYTVKEGSPALAVGFKNFPMDQFGVKKPNLKKIAKTPIVPYYKALTEEEIKTITAKAVTSTKVKSLCWLDAEFSELQGEEYSAYGIAKSDGGLVVKKFSKDSPLEKSGVQVGDVLLLIADKAIINKTAFWKIVNSKKDKNISLTIVRNQSRKEITVK